MHLSAFDLDKTLITCNCSYLFSKYLYKKKVLDFKSRCFCLLRYLRFCLDGTQLHTLHHQVFDTLFKGRLLSEFSVHIGPFLESHLDTVWNHKAIKYLQEAKSAGHTLLLLSSSPQFLVEPIAQRLGIEHWISTHYQTDEEGRLSEIAYLITGQEKSKKLSDYAAALNIPLKSTTTYSDSYDDLPFLELSGCPIAVNPDRKLRKMCVSRKWKMI